jgi:predicted RNA-binding protein
MCLSAVYEIKDGNEKLVCEHTAAIGLDGGMITLTDIMGEEVVITGILKSIDLAKNIIKIEV